MQWRVCDPVDKGPHHSFALSAPARARAASIRHDDDGAQHKFILNSNDKHNTKYGTSNNTNLKMKFPLDGPEWCLVCHSFFRTHTHSSPINQRPDGLARMIMIACGLLEHSRTTTLPLLVCGHSN